MYIFLSKQAEWPALSITGLIFSGLAGVAGAVGALCVIFATKSAVGAAREAGLSPETFRLYIAPLIFGLAPVINTLVSVLWHPKPGEPFHFELELPGWKLWVGIVMVGVGAALVLFSKEEAESSKGKAGRVAPVPAIAAADGTPAAPRVADAPPQQ
jgi:hypothetical protein